MLFARVNPINAPTIPNAPMKITARKSIFRFFMWTGTAAVAPEMKNERFIPCAASCPSPRASVR